MAIRAGPAIIPAEVAVTRGKSGSQIIVNAAASTVPNQRATPNSSGPTVLSGDRPGPHQIRDQADRGGSHQQGQVGTAAAGTERDDSIRADPQVRGSKRRERNDGQFNSRAHGRPIRIVQ